MHFVVQIALFFVIIQLQSPLASVFAEESADAENAIEFDEGDEANLFLDKHPLFGLLFLQLSRNERVSSRRSHRHREKSDARFFNQWLDHSTPGTDTFKQRYFLNEQYFVFNKTRVDEEEEKQAIVKNILFIGGPTPLGAQHVADETLPHVSVAKQFSANVWALEHRFYGQSTPPATNTAHGADRLRLLHSDQALVDIAHFIRRKNVDILKQLKISSSSYDQPKIKWILFSHSTPLALWFCEKYGKEYCSGVVASSPAAAPTLSFYQYHQHVEEAFATIGGQQCADQAAAAILTLRRLVQSDAGRANLSSVLDLRPPFDARPVLQPRDFQHFFAIIATAFQTAAQYNDVKSVGIAKLCAILAENQHLNEVEQIARVLSFYRLHSAKNGVQNSYLQTVKMLRDESSASAHLTERMWLWQACNEFGFAPTTDYGRGWFAASVPNNFYIDLCTHVFGSQFDVERIQASLRSTASHHGVRSFSGKNAVITAGQFDPWRSVHVREATNPDSVHFIEIAGASHASDFLLTLDDRTPNSTKTTKNTFIARRTSSWHAKREQIVQQWFLEPEQHAAKASHSDETDPFIHARRHSLLSINNDGAGEWRTAVRPLPSPSPAGNKRQFKKSPPEEIARVEFEPNFVDVKADLAATLFASSSHDDEDAQSPKHGQTQRNLRERRRHRTFHEQMEQQLREILDDESQRNATRVVYDDALVQRGRIEQVLDHFGGSDTVTPLTGSIEFGTKNTTETKGNFTTTHEKLKKKKKNENDGKWKQYFYRNAQHWKPGGPAFLMIGGEGRIRSNWVLEHWQSAVWARKFGADIYALEHRFYGESSPTGENFTTANLQYLTVEQALADAAVFIRSMNTQFNYSKWVVFGGSYAGNLAAWFRAKYPELASGAISSSGPVHAQVDFFEYKQVVQNAVKQWGTDGCMARIEQFVALLGRAFASVGGRQTIARVLNVCDDDATTAGWLTGDDEKVAFVDEHDLWLVADSFGDTGLSGVVQYDRQSIDPKQNHRGVQRHCAKFDVMSNLSISADDTTIDWAALETPLKQLAKSLGAADAFCQSISYQTYAKNNYLDATTRGWRIWFWQTCNEFGYFQTTNSGKNMFESLVPVNLYVDLCADAFGAEFNRSHTERRVAEMNALFGGRESFNGSNVVFINGSGDPWHALSIIDETSVSHSSVKAILIDGTSHCRDMLFETETDVPALKQARLVAEAEIAKWLSSAAAA